MRSLETLYRETLEALGHREEKVASGETLNTTPSYQSPDEGIREMVNSLTSTLIGVSRLWKVGSEEKLRKALIDEIAQLQLVVRGLEVWPLNGCRGSAAKNTRLDRSGLESITGSRQSRRSARRPGHERQRNRSIAAYFRFLYAENAAFAAGSNT